LGLFNTVGSNLACVHCGAVSSYKVQFKYGNCYQYEYEIGDEIEWSGDDSSYDWGDPNQVAVVVEGVGGPCPNCREEFLNFDVFTQNGIIRDVRPHDPKYDFDEDRPESNIIELDRDDHAN